MPFRVEGFAIISDDGMLADATGVMPSALVVGADQQFLSDSLDRVDLIVHGRNSHENQENSPRRRRLIATRQIKTVAPAEKFGHALFWNPAGFPLEKAAELLGVRDGTVAILGGTQIYDLFLGRYDVFHLSRLAGLRLQAGHPVFSQVPKLKPEAVLASSGLIPHPDDQFGLMVRSRAQRGVSNHVAAPSFETHRFAMLLRMRRIEAGAELIKRISYHTGTATAVGCGSRSHNDQLAKGRRQENAQSCSII